MPHTTNNKGTTKSAKGAKSHTIPEHDPVNHPSHYTQHPSGVECIEIAEHMPFNVGSAMKYLWRADFKGAPIQDLEKARFFISREIDRRKKEVAA